MVKDDLKCVLIGRDVEIYTDLAILIRKLDPVSRFKQVELNKLSIVETLKKINGPSLIFISDEVAFSLELLSDLTWQYNSDAIIVIVTRKSSTVSIKKRFNNTLFSRININKDNKDRISTLNFLIQSAREKADFRRCKNLLGISEKRCQWLVDSSREAIAYISRDVHWYANAAYLELLGISSIQELRSITVKDVIISDEHLLFDGFQRNQGVASDKRRSMMLSIKKLNGSIFRANIYLIPSVFKGHKCFQLWVRKINTISSTEDKTPSIEKNELIDTPIFAESIKPDASKNSRNENPFSSLLDKNSDTDNSNQTPKTQQAQKLSEAIRNEQKQNVNLKKKKYSYNSLLKGVINRKEARLVVSAPLKYLKQNETRNKKVINHQMVTLKVASAQKKGIDDLLLKLPENFDQQKRSIFWDKVKFSRIIQIIIRRKQLPINMLLQVSESSILDSDFIDWLIPGLKRLGEKSKKLIFLIPSNIDEKDYKQTVFFIKKLKALECQIALDSFAINKKSLILLKYAKPQYVRLSLPWTRLIQGNEAKELRLSSAIRQLEGLNIKVIAPCSYSKDMRRLFVLSGASFCQERSIKTV